MTKDLAIRDSGREHEIEIVEADDKKAIMLMDRMDLEQTLAELRGEVVSKFVYLAKGKRQLSYAGIKEAARLYRNVHFGATATPLADGSWMITSYAHNLADNTRVDYPMPYPAFDAADAQESINYRANLSKSMRNALAAVLPISYLETMILRWIDETSGTRPAPANPAAAARNITPVQQPRPQLNGQRAELNALLDEFPDARAALKGGVISDANVPAAIAKLRARKTALPPAPPAQRVDPAEAVDLTIPERIEQTTAMARAKIEEIGRRKGGITNGDLPTLKVFLQELQQCDPRMDDADPQGMSGKALLAALTVRVATPEEARALVTAAAAQSAPLITEDEPPF